MNTKQFDDLARAVANGVSRRQVLKMFVAGIISTFVRLPLDKQGSMPVVKASPVSTPYFCTSEELDACIRTATEVYQQELGGCSMLCGDPNTPTCQNCLDAAAHTTLASFDNCQATSCTSEVPPFDEHTIFLPLIYGGNAVAAAPQTSSASATVETCDPIQLYECRQHIVWTANAGLGACALTDCLVGPPACYRCVAKVVAMYAAALAWCLHKYACPGLSFCSNNVCCGISETGCGGTCCTSEQECVDGKCVCDPRLCNQCETCDFPSGRCVAISNPKPCGNYDCCGSCEICDYDQCRPCNLCETCDSNGNCVAKTCDNSRCEICDPTTGQCTSTCGSNQICCSEQCVDIDSNNCGTCGKQCAANEFCYNSQCLSNPCPTATGVHNGTFVPCVVNGQVQCHCNSCGNVCNGSGGFACCSDGCQYITTTCARQGH